MNIETTNAALESSSAEERVAFVLERSKPHVVLSSSFGAQAAVCLHLVTQQWPEIPVVLLDTQYLFPETYRFVDALTERLNLNLHIYKNPLSAAWQEARYGKLWEQGAEGILRYNQMNKVEPMQRALRELEGETWITGLRRQQSSTRQNLGVLAEQDGILKVHPIIDWTDHDVYLYLKKYDLPYHPLWEQGYVSIGDVHTTRPLSEGMTAEETRFFGMGRECGLHQQPKANGISV
jgi:phosphoadenosine phosphosulfate reductase